MSAVHSWQALLSSIGGKRNRVGFYVVVVVPPPLLPPLQRRFVARVSQLSSFELHRSRQWFFYFLFFSLPLAFCV